MCLNATLFYWIVVVASLLYPPPPPHPLLSLMPKSIELNTESLRFCVSTLWVSGDDACKCFCSARALPINVYCNFSSSSSFILAFFCHPNTSLFLVVGLVLVLVLLCKTKHAFCSVCKCSRAAVFFCSCLKLALILLSRGCLKMLACSQLAFSCCVCASSLPCKNISFSLSLTYRLLFCATIQIPLCNCLVKSLLMIFFLSYSSFYFSISVVHSYLLLGIS